MSKEQLVDLLNQALPCAEKMLHKHRSFHPYGAVLDERLDVELVGANLRGEIPQADELVEGLIRMLREHAHERSCRATALVVDVRVQPPKGGDETDAVMVSLEHSDGTLVDVFLPYTLQASGEVRYGEMFTTSGEGRVFDSGGDAGPGNFES